MGYRGLVDEGVVTQDATPIASPRSMQPPSSAVLNGSPDHDPIWALSKEEMVRLCRVYEEEMGLMYPVVNIEQIIIHGTNLFDFIDAALRTNLANPNTPVKGIYDEQSLVLKMVLACAAVVEGNGQSEIGYRLFESVREAADRILHGEAIEVKSLPLLVVVVGQKFILLHSTKPVKPETLFHYPKRKAQVPTWRFTKELALYALLRIRTRVSLNNP
jgi:hypothetical protein